MPDSEHPLAEGIVQVDNDRVRVTEWRFAAGSSTGPHRHQYDYVVVPLCTGKLLVRSAEGETPGQLSAGQAYFRYSGVEHEVINDNDVGISFVEIELKG